MVRARCRPSELADELAYNTVSDTDLLLELLQRGLVDLALVDLRLSGVRPGFCDFQLFESAPTMRISASNRAEEDNSSFEMSSGCPGDTACLNAASRCQTAAKNYPPQVVSANLSKPL